MINLLVFDFRLEVTPELAGKASPDPSPAENLLHTNPLDLGGMRSLATARLGLNARKRRIDKRTHFVFIEWLFRNFVYACYRM